MTKVNDDTRPRCLPVLWGEGGTFTPIGSMRAWQDVIEAEAVASVRRPSSVSVGEFTGLYEVTTTLDYFAGRQETTCYLVAEREGD